MSDREEVERPRHTPQARSEDEGESAGADEPGATPQARTDEEAD